jgi:heme oxygenase
MSMRERLRAATADIHEALHRAATFARIADGIIDLAGYRELLQFLHRYHGAMAPLCAKGAAALGAPELEAAHRERLAALVNDLSFCSAQPSPCADDAGAEPFFAAGCLYTVQGSTLGGKVIFGQLDYLLPDARGRSFFQGSAQDGARWRLLCQRLESHDAHLAEMEQGARHAFMRFESLLAEAG